MLSISQPVTHKSYQPVNKIYEIFREELTKQERLSPTCLGSAQGKRPLLYGELWAYSIQRLLNRPSLNSEPRTRSAKPTDH